MLTEILLVEMDNEIKQKHNKTAIKKRVETKIGDFKLLILQSLFILFTLLLLNKRSLEGVCESNKLDLMRAVKVKIYRSLAFSYIIIFFKL